MKQKHLHKQARRGSAGRDYAVCIGAAACLGGASLSLLLASVVNYDRAKGSIASGIAASILFWALLLAGAFLAWRACCQGSRLARRDTGSAGARYRRARLGLLTLAANREGLAAEVIFGLGVVLWVLRFTGAVTFPAGLRQLPVSFLLGGLLLHSFFNGKNYIYIKYLATAR